MNAAFFDAVRAAVFGGKLTQKQIDGMNVIDGAWRRYGDGNLQRKAYVFATAAHETAWTMQPIYERGAKSYFDKYEPGTAIGKRLGNTKRGDGYLYRGRGFVQITGRSNYARVGKSIGVDLIASPDMALDPIVAGRIIVVGTLEGWFTGKGLSDYIDDVDEPDDADLKEFLQARRTVNGTDKAASIAALALKFEAALKLAPPAPITAPINTNWIAALLRVLINLLPKKRA